MTARFPSPCPNCEAGIEAGDDIARTDGRWAHRDCAAPKLNPWIDQHMAGEMEYTGGEYTRAKAAQLVRSEFAGAPAPEPCGSCGEPAHYRATVGAMQCPSCRAIRYGVWVHRETGEERRSMAASVEGYAEGMWRSEDRWTS
jgi:predicted RNA-binding Zn-ribbon protein involved in translation (DUF1610 family)